MVLQIALKEIEKLKKDKQLLIKKLSFLTPGCATSNALIHEIFQKIGTDEDMCSLHTMVPISAMTNIEGHQLRCVCCHGDYDPEKDVHRSNKVSHACYDCYCLLVLFICLIIISTADDR